MNSTSHDQKTPAATIENWQEPENLRWSFQHMDELFPTAVISGSPAPGTDVIIAHENLDALPVTWPDGTDSTVHETLTSTDTDAWMLIHGNRVVAEEYFGTMNSNSPHLLMSVSKSIVSAVVGVLVGSGKIDPEGLVTEYIPELARSGYAGATVRDLLDMRSGIKFSEEYLDPESEVRKLDKAVGLAPRTEGEPSTLKEFLATLQQKSGHGGPFEYRSCETDVLGWICEAATGRRFSLLASDLVWSRMGANEDGFIVVDSEGTGMFDGGICATLRDLGRFGTMIRDQGISLTGNRVVPSSWVEDIFAGGPDSAVAFDRSRHGDEAPGGQYRSQFWFPSADRNVALCWGIHGQLVYINRRSGVVGIKLSSCPLPVDPVKDPAAIAMFEAISKHVSTRQTVRARDVYSNSPAV